MSITNVCTKLLLQITRTVPAAGGPDMLTWGDVGIHGPGCLQPKLGSPPVSPLGVVPNRKKDNRISYVIRLIRNCIERKRDTDPMVAHSFHLLA